MTPDLKILADKKDALLMVEMGAWLHMFSKFHEKFLEGTKDFDINIPPDLSQSHFLLYSLLTEPWTGQVWDRLGIEELNANQLSIFNLIHEHRNKYAYNGLEKLMWDSHGRGSGIEKGTLERFARKQNKIIYLSTAFGFEKNPIDKQDIINKRNILYDNLQLHLNELRKTNAHPSNGWRIFRRSFITMLSELFLLTVADTRRPLNDVSLFDQTVASVAFIKASLAQILLSQKWKNPTEKSITEKYQWRILRIGFNGVAFLTKSLKISDIDARKQLIYPVLDEIRDLIETDYPMGYEIYRDEMGSAFIVPDINDLLDSKLSDGKPLTEIISDLSREKFDLEANFHLFPLTSSNRNMQSFGDLISKTPEDFIDEKWIKDIQELWPEINEVCAVCNLRPKGPNKKSISRNVCDICEERRKDRAKIWSEKLDHTIWIDEVADLNGRIALIVGTFDIENWLNGKLFSSLVAFDPSKRQLIDNGRKYIQYPFDYFDQLNDIKNRLKNPKRPLDGDSIVEKLILPKQREGAKNGQFGQIYDLYVLDTDLHHEQKEDWRLALTMIRQQPSPARIRRVWETTKKFWEETTTDFINTVGQVETRIEIHGELHPEKPGENLDPYHVYEVHIENVKLSVVWDKPNNRFITSENLEYLAQPEQLGQNVKKWLEMHKGNNIIIEESMGYGSKNKKWGFIAVNNVHEISNIKYIPVISILAEPRTFMALVPANKANSVLKAIKDKYENEMNKVRNRLPLTIGLVFSNSHTPIASIFDSGKRMLKIPKYNGTWKIESKNSSSSPDFTELSLRKNENKIKVKVKTVIKENSYLFSWDEISENDNRRLIDFLKQNYGVDWVDSANFEKNDDGKIIIITTEKNFISLCLNDEKTEINLKIDDGRTDKLIVKIESGKINVHEDPFDPWYPYWLVESDASGSPPSGRTRQFIGTKEKHWVHVCDLQIGDNVNFVPSRFDFEFLDSAARRFEISYKDGKRRDKRKSNRPYYLEEFSDFEKLWMVLITNLERTQIKGMLGLIETKREEWQVDPENTASSAFKLFVHDVIHNANWKNGKPVEIEEIENAAISGKLNDIAELYMYILKDK